MKTYKIIKTLTLIVVIVIILAVSFIFYFRHNLVKLTKRNLDNYMSKTLNADFSVSSIEFNFPYEVTLKNVFVETEDLIFVVEDITISLNPIKLIKRRDIIGSITHLNLNRPRLVFKQVLKHINASLTSLNRPNLSLYWKNGYLHLPKLDLVQIRKIKKIFPVPEKIFSKRHIVRTKSGYIKYKDQYLGAKVVFDENVSLEAKYNSSNENLDGKISLKNYEISKLADLMPEITKLEADGKFDTTLSVSGTLLEPRLMFDYVFKENVSVNDVKFSTRGKGKYHKGHLSIDGDFVTKGYDKENQYGAYHGKFNFRPKIPYVNFNISSRELDIKLLAKLLDVDIPVGGKTVFLLGGDGKFNELQLKLSLEGKSLNYSGRIFPGFWKNAKLDFRSRISRGETLYEIHEFEIKTDNQRISCLPGSWISMKKDSEGEFKIGFNMRNFKLTPGIFFGKVNMRGEWLKRNGRFSLDTTVDTDGLWLNQHMFTNTKFRLRYESDATKQSFVFSPCPGQNYTLSGRIDILRPSGINFSDIAIKHKNYGFLKIDGLYTKKGTCSLTLYGQNVNCETLTGLTDFKIPLSGLANFTAVLKRSAAEPYLVGTLNIASGEIYDLPFTNFNLQYNYINDVLDLTSIRILQVKNKKEYAVISGRGKIPLYVQEIGKGFEKCIGNETMNLHLTLERGDLSILEALTDTVESVKGNLTAGVEVTGTLLNPKYKGLIKVDKGYLQCKNYIRSLRDISVDLEFIDDRLVVDNFVGKIGNGTIALTGYTSFTRLFKLDECNLTLSTVGKKGIKITVPELSMLVGRPKKQLPSFGEPVFSLNLAGRKENLKLSGFIQLDDTRFSYPPLKGTKENELISKLFGDSEWDVELRTGRNTWYESDTMHLNIDGSLRLTNKLPDLIVNGKIESLKGRINYINKSCDVKQAVFEIINNECFFQATAETSAVFMVSRQPVDKEKIDKEIDKKVGKVEIIIPRAPVGEVEPIFVSREHYDMSSEKLLEATYGLGEEIGPEERALFLKRQLVRMFDSTLHSPLARSFLQRSKLIDDVVVSYPLSNEPESKTNAPATTSLTDFLIGTKWSFEKYLARNVTLAFSFILDKEKIERRPGLRREVELAYMLKPNLRVTGTYEIDPSDISRGSDRKIMIEPYWRFGWDLEDEQKNNTK